MTNPPLVGVSTQHAQNANRGFKKGSGTVVQSTLRAVPATVPDPFLNREPRIVQYTALSPLSQPQLTEIENRKSFEVKNLGLEFRWSWPT